MKGRPGERDDEFLIGDLELPYTCALDYHQTRHFLISFNERVKHPVEEGLSSLNTEQVEEVNAKGTAKVAGTCLDGRMRLDFPLYYERVRHASLSAR